VAIPPFAITSIVNWFPVYLNRYVSERPGTRALV
jgi:hypothetical protein